MRAGGPRAGLARQRAVRAALRRRLPEQGSGQARPHQGPAAVARRRRHRSDALGAAAHADGGQEVRLVHAARHRRRRRRRCSSAATSSQPVILGGVWSKPDFSPEPNEDGKNNFRGYRSRSGHRLILDDTDKTKVVFADKTTQEHGRRRQVRQGRRRPEHLRGLQAADGGRRRASRSRRWKARWRSPARTASCSRSTPSRTSRSTPRPRSTSRPAGHQDGRLERRQADRRASPSNYDAPKINIG